VGLNRKFTFVWVALLVLVVGAELVALWLPGKGDTLTEHVQAVYLHPTWGQFAAWMCTALLLWMAWHFLLPRLIALFHRLFEPVRRPPE